MAVSFNSISIKKHFSRTDYITTSDIKSFYQAAEPGITDSTLHWRIYNLVKTGKLKRTGRGVFVFTDLIEFSHDLLKEDIKIFKKVHKNFPYISLCIWNTRLFNHFMNHQLFRYYTLVEVERIAMEPVFNFLSDNGYRVLLNPSSEIMNLYAGRDINTIIVIPLISQSPLLKQESVFTPSLEKVLVDIFCNSTIFASEQGSEMLNIFSKSFERYRIHLHRMLRYAKRRGNHDALIAWLRNNLELPQQWKDIEKV